MVGGKLVSRIVEDYETVKAIITEATQKKLNPGRKGIIMEVTMTLLKKIRLAGTDLELCKVVYLPFSPTYGQHGYGLSIFTGGRKETVVNLIYDDDTKVLYGRTCEVNPVEWTYDAAQSGGNAQVLALQAYGKAGWAAYENLPEHLKEPMFLR